MDWRSYSVVAVATIIALVLLVMMRKMQHSTDQAARRDRSEPVDRYLRRTDLMDGKEPENIFEWVIKFSVLPKAQIGILVAVLIVAVVFALAGFRSFAAVGFYFTIMAVFILLMFAGWDRLESYFGVESDVQTADDNRLHYDSLPEGVQHRLRDAGIPTGDRDGSGESNEWTGELKIILTLAAILMIIILLLNFVLETIL